MWMKWFFWGRRVRDFRDLGVLRNRKNYGIFKKNDYGLGIVIFIRCLFGYLSRDRNF